MTGSKVTSTTGRFYYSPNALWNAMQRTLHLFTEASFPDPIFRVGCLTRRWVHLHSWAHRPQSVVLLQRESRAALCSLCGRRPRDELRGKFGKQVCRDVCRRLPRGRGHGQRREAEAAIATLLLGTRAQCGHATTDTTQGEGAAEQAHLKCQWRHSMRRNKHGSSITNCGSEGHCELTGLHLTLFFLSTKLKGLQNYLQNKIRDVNE